MFDTIIDVENVSKKKDDPNEKNITVFARSFGINIRSARRTDVVLPFICPLSVYGRDCVEESHKAPTLDQM
jgi:hypothetical protein